MENEKIEKVIEAVKKCNGLIDDHDGKFYELKKDGFSYEPTGIGAVLLHDGWELFCMYDNSRYYSVNGVYLGEDGKAHLSTWSISGVLQPFRDQNHGFDFYNKEIEENPGWIAQKKEFKVVYAA